VILPVSVLPMASETATDADDVSNSRALLPLPAQRKAPSKERKLKDARAPYIKSARVKRSLSSGQWSRCLAKSGLRFAAFVCMPKSIHARTTNRSLSFYHRRHLRHIRSARCHLSPVTDRKLQLTIRHLAWARESAWGSVAAGSPQSRRWSISKSEFRRQPVRPFSLSLSAPGCGSRSI
jgi:hypothetical protein